LHFFLLDVQPQRQLPGVGDVVLLSAEESHHLFHVLRGGRTDPVNLIDGNGRYYRGVLLGKQNRCARLRIDAAWDDPGEVCEPRLALACALVKGRHFEWALEKATELGVHVIWPLRTERSVVLPGEGRQQRWLGLLRAALKQSGRSYLPRLQPVIDLRACLEKLHEALVVYGDVADPAGDNNAITPTSVRALLEEDYLAAQPEGGAAAAPAGGGRTGVASAPPFLAWVVGPEGGWSDDERHLLSSSGARAVSLGPHRLRTETAAVAGLSLLQVLRERWLP
jgi:16S rRNA (uracil1498-N3)-methyltransferase